jgi:hypothetical protein
LVEEDTLMCRSIKTLYNFEPPATEDEIRQAALQFVRKLSGSRRPSKVNEAAFFTAVEAVASASTILLSALSTSSPPKVRVVEPARR